MSCRGLSKTGEVAEFGHGGHRHGELDAAQGLEGVDDRGEPPGLHLLCEVLVPDAAAVRCVR